MSADVEADVEALCLACGLCCDGTLFTHVALADDERARLHARVRLRSLQDGRVVLDQPCAALRERRCAAYRDRPQGCRDYECLLVKARRENEASLAALREHVDHAHALSAALAAALPPPEPGEAGSPLVRARRLAQRNQEPALDDASREAKRALENHLRFHFGWKG